ncbi:MAG: hypothetical protein NQU41_03410 [Candidatus Methanosuratincola sp.]|jgi:tetrahydromethanopterin S-methyltransferase subunit H|uniref:Tetrahydromethanopterin S-methyltransferase subunit H n=1 Tax=Methanosuratincola subterraneus TaxID=2593994 RepID=A0A444L5Z1_METS7|nr:hypothetical protein [Candidatus Methanosuratincola sp.]RWX72966.1 MAG: hypothetical protein Metus_0940 [Candidatus Methanosuratincola subterraneus]
MRAPPYVLGNARFGAVGKPVLVGSLFYRGDKKVSDHRTGEVDTKRVKSELETAERVARRVGLPHAVDVIAETPEAMCKYIGLLADLTESPLLIGGLNEESRVAGYRKALEIGISSRCGVNSVSTCTAETELAELGANKIRFAIIQTLDPSAVYPEEKLALLRDVLLGRCESAGIEGAAVDVGIIDFTSTHLAVESMKLIRKELGLPCGCAPSNAAYQTLLKKKVSRKSARAINSALNTIVQLGGADFIIYGPLKASTYIFEAVAVVEAIKAYGARLSGDRSVDKDHPLFKFLPKLG